MILKYFQIQTEQHIFSGLQYLAYYYIFNSHTEEAHHQYFLSCFLDDLNGVVSYFQIIKSFTFDKILRNNCTVVLS